MIHIYLTPNEHKVYQEKTLNKPSKIWFGVITDSLYDELPDIMPIKPMDLTFQLDVVMWLDECKECLDIENTPLRAYLNQYQQYCKNL